MYFQPKMLIPLVVVSGLVAGGYAIDRNRKASRTVLSGVFESQPAQIASRVSGRVQRIDVNEGDAVKPEQRLIVFESTDQEYEAGAAEAAAEQARAQALEVQKGPRAEEILRQQAVVDELAADLGKLQAGSRPEEIGAGTERVRQAKARLRELQAGARPQELAQARAAEREAFARLGQARRGLTTEERAQLRAQLSSAEAQERLAADDAERQRSLFEQGAIARAQYEAAQTRAITATQARVAAQQVYERAQRGTPAEELAQVQAAYNQALARLRLVQAGSRPEDIQAARAEVGVAQQNLNLLQRGSRAEDVAAAKARLEQAKATLAELKNGSRPEAIAQAQAAAKAAEQKAKAIRQRLTERRVEAPTEGNVDRILVAVGDLVQAGAPVAQMSDPADIWLRVYVPESRLGRIKVKDSADLRVDGIEGTVAAQVESVASRGEFTPANVQTPEERGKQVFAARLRLKTPDARVKAGMGATVLQIGDWRP